jgi:hypothetical protein
LVREIASLGRGRGGEKDADGIKEIKVHVRELYPQIARICADEDEVSPNQ